MQCSIPRALGACTLAALAAIGCDARVKDFSATPRHICAGDRVQLAWAAVGSASLTITPAVDGAPNGRVDESGVAMIAPRANTRAELHVTRFLGSDATSVQEIEVRAPAPSDKPEALAASIGDAASHAGCRDGRIWATVHANRFAPGVKVASVAGHLGDDRTYDVEHAGLRATVAPGTNSTSFAGTAIAGDWVLSSPLKPGETCGTPTVPRNLVVDVFTQCTPGGAT